MIDSSIGNDKLEPQPGNESAAETASVQPHLDQTPCWRLLYFYKLKCHFNNIVTDVC